MLEAFEKRLQEAGRRRQAEAAQRRLGLNEALDTISKLRSQLRDPQSSYLSSSSSSNAPNPTTFKIFDYVVRDGAVSQQFKGETPWDDIYKTVTNVEAEMDDSASDISDEEFHRKDNHSQDNEDVDEEEYDDRSAFTTFSNISKASRSSHASNLSAKSDASRLTTTTQGSQRRKKLSDEEMKITAYNMTFCELSKQCKCAQPCSDNLKFAQVCTCTKSYLALANTQKLTNAMYHRLIHSRRRFGAH